MSNELLPCPFCGEKAIPMYPKSDGSYASVGCSNRFCSLRNLFTVEDWNRRFVCLDKNGDKVYSDSTIIGVRGDQEVDECQVCYESFQWCAVEAQATYGVRQSYALSGFDEIELIESESDK